jgi:predicted aconitase
VTATQNTTSEVAGLLEFYVGRVSGNRLPSLLRELADAIEQEDDAEQLRRLGTSLRQMGNIALSRIKR